MSKRFGEKIGSRLEEISDRSSVLLRDVRKLSDEMQEYYPWLLEEERTDEMNEMVRSNSEKLAVIFGRNGSGQFVGICLLLAAGIDPGLKILGLQPCTV